MYSRVLCRNFWDGPVIWLMHFVNCNSIAKICFSPNKRQVKMAMNDVLLVHLSKFRGKIFGPKITKKFLVVGRKQL